MLKILSCYFLHLNYRWQKFEKENLANLLINVVLTFIWGFFVHWLTKKAFFSLSITNPAIIEGTTLVLLITTLYAIYVHFPQREKTRKFRKKSINLLVMIGTNVVLSFNTYYTVQKTMTINEITLSVISWMIAIALLLFTLTDFLTYSIISYEIPYYILKEYAKKKKVARKRRKQFLKALKAELVQVTKIPVTIDFIFYEVNWFLRKNNFTLKQFISNIIIVSFMAISFYYIIEKEVSKGPFFKIMEDII
ncbi:hypothetical protein LDQ54_002848, partial [Listeria innocua]|nr:hypothetical protein [Listeria innocua]